MTLIIPERLKDLHLSDKIIDLFEKPNPAAGTEVKHNKSAF